jgi:hypothetical protein
MHGTITIELQTKTPDTGSGLPELGYDAYSLLKNVPGIEYKDANGKERPIGDKYRITDVRISAGPIPGPEPA